jgi:predicted Ser/Thr protein kinase
MKTDWIQIQRDNAKKINKKREGRIIENLKELGFLPETYTSGRKREENDEIFYGLVDNDEYIVTEDGTEIDTMTLVTFNLDELGTEYFVDENRPVSESGLPVLFKICKN